MKNFIKRLFCKHKFGYDLYNIRTGKKVEITDTVSDAVWRLVRLGYTFPYWKHKCEKCGAYE